MKTELIIIKLRSQAAEYQAAADALDKAGDKIIATINEMILEIDDIRAWRNIYPQFFKWISEVSRGEKWPNIENITELLNSINHLDSYVYGRHTAISPDSYEIEVHKK
jgi:hypothetical protein